MDLLARSENAQRIAYMMAVLSVTSELLGDFATTKLDWAKDKANLHFGPVCEQHILSMGRAQLAKASETIPAQIFIDTLRELLISKNVAISTSDIEEKKRVGYLKLDHEKTGQAYVIPNVSLTAVKEFLAKSGVPFEISLKALSTSLDDKGFLAEKGDGRNTKKAVIAGVGGMEFWVIKKADLFGKDTSDSFQAFVEKAAQRKFEDEVD